jgi:hypothetical protein
MTLIVAIEGPGYSIVSTDLLVERTRAPPRSKLLAKIADSRLFRERFIIEKVLLEKFEQSKNNTHWMAPCCSLPMPAIHRLAITSWEDFEKEGVNIIKPWLTHPSAAASLILYKPSSGLYRCCSVKGPVALTKLPSPSIYLLSGPQSLTKLGEHISSRKYNTPEELALDVHNVIRLTIKENPKDYKGAATYLCNDEVRRIAIDYD